MLACPECSSGRIHPSKRRGVVERKVLPIILVRPFRCEDCDYRFFRWVPGANPNSPKAFASRISKWLHYEDDLTSGGHPSV